MPLEKTIAAFRNELILIDFWLDKELVKLFRKVRSQHKCALLSDTLASALAPAIGADVETVLPQGFQDLVS